MTKASIFYYFSNKQINEQYSLIKTIHFLHNVILRLYLELF